MPSIDDNTRWLHEKSCNPPELQFPFLKGLNTFPHLNICCFFYKIMYMNFTFIKLVSDKSRPSQCCFQRECGVWTREWHHGAAQASPGMESSIYCQLAKLSKENQQIEVQIPQLKMWLYTNNTHFLGVFWWSNKNIPSM